MIYKIEYSLELVSRFDSIEAQVVKTYNFMVDNAGTDFNCLIEESDYNLATQLEDLMEKLTTYFYNIFFSSKLQTFVYLHNGEYLYDPYLIEFLIRNKVMSYGRRYIHIAHACYPGQTFSMDYARSFFNNLENPTTTSLDNVRFYASAYLITDPNSLFLTRLERYFMIRYFDEGPYKIRFNVFDPDVIDHLKSGELFDDDSNKSYYNIWVKYFKGDTNFIDGKAADTILNKIDYMDNMEHFYAIPIYIFMIQRFIKGILAGNGTI